MSRSYLRGHFDGDPLRAQQAEAMERRGLRHPNAVGTPWRGLKKEYGDIIGNSLLKGSIRGFLIKYSRKQSLNHDVDVIWEAFKNDPLAKRRIKKHHLEEVKQEFTKQLESQRASSLVNDPSMDATNGPLPAAAPGSKYSSEATRNINPTILVEPTVTKFDTREEPSKNPSDIRLGASNPSALPKRKPVGAARSLHESSLIPSAAKQGSYTYRSLSSQARQTMFRLLILNPGESDEVLDCYLTMQELNDCPPYEALSYCWGAPMPTEFIHLDGYTFEARISLVEALRCLRLTNTPRLLWIDAICINQTDFREREQQVRIMREIYHRANQVLIWLGAPDKVGSDAIELLVELATLANGASSATAEVTQSFGSLAINESRPQINQHSGQNLRARSDCVRTLLLRDWFSRIWTVQEVTVARRSMVMWGDRMYDWEVISSGISEGFRRDLFHTSFMGPTLEIVFQRHAALAAAKDEASGNTHQRFQQLLANFRNRKATDDRDKVFALLGLVHRDFDLNGTAPDYDLSVADLYIRTAIQLLKESNDLTALSFALSNVDSNLREELPSWVPDWSNRRTIAVPFPSNNFDSGSDSSSDRSVANYCFRHDGTMPGLQVNVYSWDLVANVAEPLDLPLAFSWEDLEGRQNQMKFWELPDDIHERPFSERMMLSLRILGSIPRATLDGLRPFAKYIRTFVEWERFAGVVDITSGSAASVSARSIYMQTLVAGRSPQGLETLFEEWTSSLKIVRQAVKTKLDKRDDLFTVVAVAGYMKQTWHRFPAFNQLLEHANLRRLAWTRNGHLALVPSHAQVGDAVGQFSGSRAPLVCRRRKDGDWTLVGQAYINGLLPLHDTGHSSSPICLR